MMLGLLLPALACALLRLTPRQSRLSVSPHVHSELAVRWRPRFVNTQQGEWFTRLRARPRVLVDMFTFNDELDALEIRLGSYVGIVDHHVLLEANSTFTGIPKALHYANEFRWNLSAACQETLHAYEVRLPAGGDASARDLAARRQYEQAFANLASDIAIGNSSEVLIMSHDIDELPHHELLWLLKWSDDLPPLPLLPRMRYYYYGYMWHVVEVANTAAALEHLRVVPHTGGPLIGTHEQMRELWRAWPHAAATMTPYARSTVNDAGWHCSWCLPVPLMRSKLFASSHTEFSQRPKLATERWLVHVKRTGADIAQRPGAMAVAVNALDEAPPYVITNRRRFDYLLRFPQHDARDGLPHEHLLPPPSMRTCGHTPMKSSNSEEARALRKRREFIQSMPIACCSDSPLGSPTTPV